MHWYCCNDAESWLTEAKRQMFRSTVSFKFFKIHLHFVCLPACLPACHLPAVRPSSTRCTAPETSDSQGNGDGFTNLLFQLTFVHCTIVIPFILYNPSLFFCITLNKVRNSPKKVSINSQPLFMTLHKTLFAHVTAVNNVIDTSRCFRVYLVTS